jgi:hypothetical protein
MDIAHIMALPLPVQNPHDWQFFLEFSEAYFRNRGFESPMVVEIGSHEGKQKAFWAALGFRHVSIDIDAKYGTPDIFGDAHDPEIVARAKTAAGDGDMPIDLLFIDGDHSYLAVRQDFEFYSPMTRHIVAFHDIYFHKGPTQFWSELVGRSAEAADFMFVEFGAWHNPRARLGIGVAIRMR